MTDEHVGGGTTRYLVYDLRNGAPGTTALFMPDGFRLGRSVDLILYLHGYFPSGVTDLRGYLNDRRISGIRSAVGASGRDVALVVPALGRADGASTIGRLATVDGLERYLQAMLQAVTDHGDGRVCRPHGPPGSIILAGHSAGGLGLIRIAELVHSFEASVREVWALDCFYYGEAPRWIAWARRHPRARFHGVHTSLAPKFRTRRQAEAIAAAGLSNIDVTADPANDHHTLPARMFPVRLRASASLSAAPAVALP